MPTDRMGKTLHFELEDLGTSVGFPYDLLIVSPLLIVTFSKVTILLNCWGTLPFLELSFINL